MGGYSFSRAAIFLPTATVLLVGLGCPGGGGDTQPDFESLETGLFGSVRNASGHPLRDAIVDLDGSVAVTDAKGEFVIASSTAGAKVATFRAHGYLSCIRRVTLADGSPTAAHALLKERALATSVSADAGGMVIGAREAAVTIEPGDLRGSTQAPITGEVDVYVTPVDPSNDDEVQALTSSFADGVSLLESFGMVDVTVMQGTEELDVADGETLEIQIPAPAATLQDPPGSMPLWSLDEATGRWVEEGAVTFDEVSGTYVGEITHLSAWNADIPATATCITGLVVDSEDVPVAGAEVDAKGKDYSGSSSGNTGGDGRFYVPVRKSSRVLVSVVHAAGGGDSRIVTSGAEDTTLPPTPGDDRCLDVGKFTIERKKPPKPSCKDVVCEDTGNECTVAECSEATGRCNETEVADGTECDDGVGSCSAGQCVNLCADVDCTSDSDCVQDGTCDPSSGICIEGDNEPPDTTCTAIGGGAGTCQGSVCVPVGCTVPGDCDDGDACTIDVCTDDGACDYTANVGGPCEVEPGLPGACDDLGACIGLCEGMDCTSTDACVRDGTCNEQTGNCVPGDPEPLNTPCELTSTEDGFCNNGGRCVECTAQEHCADDETCNSMGRCSRPGDSQVFSDNAFLDSEWTLIVRTTGRGGSASAEQVAEGGNPDDYRTVVTRHNGAAANSRTCVYALSLKDDAVYDPSAEGAITSIDYEEDAKPVSRGQSTGPVLCQGSECYLSYAASTSPLGDWQTAQRGRLLAEDFLRIDTSLGGSGLVEEYPDFSAAGAAIEFGFYRSICVNGGTWGADPAQSEGGIDNWMVEIN